MKFLTSCLVTSGKTNNVAFPNLTKQSLVPRLITLMELRDNVEVPVSGILCKVYAGNSELTSIGEPTFKLSNNIDLSHYKATVDRSGKVALVLTNKTNEPKHINIYIDYHKSFGTVLVEEKVDHFENLLNDIYRSGFCTKLVISFSKRVDAFEFASFSDISESDDSTECNWIQPFNIPIDNDLDLEDQIYTIDFLNNSELGAIYPEHLNFLEIRASAKKTEGDREPLYMYITAYGFPWSH